MRNDEGLFIDWILADRITTYSLADTKKNILEDLKNHHDGSHKLHPDDVAMYEGIVTAINILLEYYGEL